MKTLWRKLTLRLKQCENIHCHVLLFRGILRNDMIKSLNESWILKRHMQTFALEKAELTLILAPHISSALQEAIVQKHGVIG